MCLIIFSWQPDKLYPLTIVANRDEFYGRRTQKVGFWKEYPDIFGGQDQVAGGGWLAVNKQGRFAAVTNYREWPVKPASLSRGRLVRDYLSGNWTPVEYLDRIQSLSDRFAGFNLIVGGLVEGFYYFSNRQRQIRHLLPGIYGLCNHLLDTPWPKLVWAKRNIARLLDCNNQADPEALVRVMHDHSIPDDKDLPQTGIGIKRERLLSSCFIQSADYGTRNTSLLLFSDKNTLKWYEQTYGSYGVSEQSLCLDIQCFSVE
ncbi:hypothetical protein CI610_03379 [invertebrate metagenome]|uniref:NRDE family protein n=1 Tax=invertebrate metagenome TaxID=1711999 RepID=A0A2H9T393_9ZZZZ